MDRAGLPLHTGPESVDLVVADVGSLGLRGELGIGTAIASVAALVCAGLITAVTLVFGQFSLPPVLGTTAGVFTVAAAVLSWQVLGGTRRIEFRPAHDPGVVRVVGSVRSEEYPISRLRRILLRHTVQQSHRYPFVLRTAGQVGLRLEFHRGTVRESLPGGFDVPALADRLRELVSPAGVPVEVETTGPADYDPAVADDVLPRDGVALALIERRPRDRLAARPGYLFWDEVRVAWQVVWDVPRAAAANGVRARRRSSTNPQGQYVSWVEYRAVDVQRVADAIVAGTATLEPAWRTDTEEGLAALAAASAPRRRWPW
ncbi:hypothetical protein [Phytohabitans houttuyneae]|uniref:Uncharacterized protein n=1 Tax=Phytohabitans houttuyneae TaxID=1076126 RepID=A0A6V8KGY6_9ACTN|nr:hypothetical protein [Phytohabitans houttuyneae]GFJ84503.1 hypothetical protein Phou_086830 [Phytohabitans houttuyneae]